MPTMGVVALILALSLTISALVTQPAYAPRMCGACIEFKKLTHEFEKNVINAIGEPNEDPVPHLRPLLEPYSQDVMRIFLGGPDTIPGLLEQYQQAVLRVFSAPEPDKHQQHDQIKEFRQLTHGFVKGVIGAVTDPED